MVSSSIGRLCIDVLGLVTLFRNLRGRPLLVNGRADQDSVYPLAIEVFVLEICRLRLLLDGDRAVSVDAA